MPKVAVVSVVASGAVVLIPLRLKALICLNCLLRWGVVVPMQVGQALGHMPVGRVSRRQVRTLKSLRTSL